MESGDGGAEENVERPKNAEGQPQLEQGDQIQSESNAQQDQLGVGNIDGENVDESGKVPNEKPDTSATNNEGDNLIQPGKEVCEGATLSPEGHNSPKQEVMDKRHISDEESGENIPLPGMNSANVSVTSQGNTSSGTAIKDASANDNTAEESSMMKDADGTVKEDIDTAPAVTDEIAQSKDSHSEEVDKELENFFQFAQPAVGKFPALDNVDLASDEDGHGSREGETEETPAKTAQENPDVQEEVEIAASREKDGDDLQGDFEVKTSPRKDYPLNYSNYKVCREVEPGVKECLILETGEHIVCVAKPKAATSTPVPSDSPRLASSMKSEVDDEADSSTQVPASVISAEEAFAYVSFEGDGKLSSEGDATAAVGERFMLNENQQAFITENGIPVILDTAENDVKLGLQAKMDRLGKAAQGAHSPVVDEVEAADDFEHLEENEPVADVLSSGGDGDSGGIRLKESRQVKKSKKKRDKKQRFHELRPDDQEDGVDDVDEGAVLNTSNNSSGYPGQQHLREEDNENRNNSALDRDRLSEMVYEGVEAARRLRSPHGSPYGHDFNTRRLVATNISGSDCLYSPIAKKGAYGDSSRYSTSIGESSYSRYGDRSPLDSSHLSTRFSRIDRGDPSSVSSTQESLTIPRFRTLHDQQVSWLDMFKMIEDQHRNELQTQYSEHQRILQEMQQKMERELVKQQDTLKHRLQTHKEILKELSPGRRGLGHDATYSSHGQEALYDDPSHTTLDGTPVTLKYPPPLSDRFGRPEEDHLNNNYRALHEHLPTKRPFEKELSSQSCPADTSLNLSEMPISRDKLLRGGVYSSPMPFAKARQKKSKSGRLHENKCHNALGDKASSSYGDQVPSSYSKDRPQDVSLTESDDVTSPRSRLSLREKHAKHVADLRAYYEEELKEMRKMLTSRQLGDDPSRDNSASVMAAGDRILANENTELRQRCQDLDDECHDLKIEIRELQQKIQGLEIRAADYAERFDNSQSQVRSLHGRLEEVTEFAKEKEAAEADIKSKHKSHEDSMQAAYKKEKELTDSLHAAKTTIQRLVEKYETLEKDQRLLKECIAEKDEKLFMSRKEAMDANNKLSRMELENKQLLHDKDILKHELTMARSSMAGIHMSYEDAFQGSASTPSSRLSRAPLSRYRSSSTERMQRNSSQDRKGGHFDRLPDSETDSDTKSPIMKAERELKKLRESVGSSQEFAPKLQRKFYGTEMSYGSNRGSAVSSPGRSKSKNPPEVSKSSSPREKKGRSETTVNGVRSSQATSSQSSWSSHRCDNKVPKRRESDRLMETQSPAERAVQGALKRLGIENGWNSDQTLERIKAGDIVSRPAWEDVYTSMSPARSSGAANKMSGTPNMTREQLLKERLQNIDVLERKYDDLSNEKRKFESALSKVPSHGPRREKERLETELDRVDKELGSVRMSLKRFHVLKSTI